MKYEENSLFSVEWLNSTYDSQTFTREFMLVHLQDWTKGTTFQIISSFKILNIFSALRAFDFSIHRKQ